MNVAYLWSMGWAIWDGGLLGLMGGTISLPSRVTRVCFSVFSLYFDQKTSYDILSTYCLLIFSPLLTNGRLLLLMTEE